jgi:putative oxidoreductase
MIKILFASFSRGRTGTALLILRVFVGIAFLFHGFEKIMDIPAFAAEFGMPNFVAAAAAYTQFISGAMMVIGLLTPVASLALASTMAVATLQLIARGEAFVNPHGHSWEASSFYLIATLVVFLLGPGRSSLDALVFYRSYEAAGASEQSEEESTA